MFGQTKNYPGLVLFQEEDGYTILQLAKVLDPDDILEGWNITKEELEKKFKFDYKFFMDFFRQGRLAGKIKAAQTVMEGMEGKNGSDMALKYLRQFSDSWMESNEGGDSVHGLTLKIVKDSPN